MMQLPYEFFLVTREDFGKAMRLGQKFKDAERIITLANISFRKMHTMPMECLCLDCDALLDDKANLPEAFALGLPMFPDDTTDAFVCAVCPNCVDRSDLFERMLESLREMCPNATLAHGNRTKQ